MAWYHANAWQYGICPDYGIPKPENAWFSPEPFLRKCVGEKGIGRFAVDDLFKENNIILQKCFPEKVVLNTNKRFFYDIIILNTYLLSSVLCWARLQTAAVAAFTTCITTGRSLP